METVSLNELYVRLQTLTVFRSLLSDPAIEALCGYLNSGDAPLARQVSAYAEFVSCLYRVGDGRLARYIAEITGDDENIYIRTVGRGEQASDVIQECVTAELAVLQQVADLTPEALRAGLTWSGALPRFVCEQVDLAEYYQNRVAQISRYGYGMYARYHMFYVNGEGRITPVRHPDRTRLDDLIDYRREQQIILDNTYALLKNKPAANILLTGDAGTGKSSTVKAVVNELSGKGLRILEIRKEQLREIPAILDELSENPLKFILFIDDLSFQKDDDNYSALKAILEGSVSAKSKNVAIYATSNRRHIVKERFSDRDGDDVHRNDAMQEVISLSERFGIQLTFQKPDKKTYLDIVRHLADRRGIRYDPDEIDLLAERFALGRGGRSARAAKQFVDSLAANAHEISDLSDLAAKNEEA